MEWGLIGFGVGYLTGYALACWVKMRRQRRDRSARLEFDR